MYLEKDPKITDLPVTKKQNYPVFIIPGKSRDVEHFFLENFSSLCSATINILYGKALNDIEAGRGWIWYENYDGLYEK